MLHQTIWWGWFEASSQSFNLFLSQFYSHSQVVRPPLQSQFFWGPISEHHAQSCSLEYDIFQTYKLCDVVCETLKVYTFFMIFIFQSESISEAVNVKVAEAVKKIGRKRRGWPSEPWTASARPGPTDVLASHWWISKLCKNYHCKLPSLNMFNKLKGYQPASTLQWSSMHILIDDDWWTIQSFAWFCHILFF